MANFNITTVLGYSAKKEYIGSLNFRNIITLTVETLHRTNTDPRYDQEVANKKSFTIGNSITFLCNSHNLVLNQEIYFTSTGTLPTGFVLNKIYYVKSIPTLNSFTVSASLGGSNVSVSDSGSGTHYFNAVTPIKNLNEYDFPEIYQNKNIPIILNDAPFGVGRIVSVSEPRSAEFDENGLQFWKRTITFELYENGDNSSVPNNTSNPFYARLRDNLFNSRVIQISEDYSFSDGEDGILGYTQTVNVTCADEISENSPSDNTKTGAYLARQIAQNLIESEVNFGYVGNLNNLYGKAGKNTYSSDVDILNGSVSITKTFTPFLVRTPISYSFSVQQDGSIQINESVTLTNKNLATSSSNLSDIISILNNLKSSSYSRCSGYFNSYKPLITTVENVDVLTSESLNLISVVRAFDEKNQEYSQTVSYSNARNLRAYHTLEIDQNIEADNTGFVNVTETANFVSKKTKEKASDTNFLDSNYFASGVTVKSLMDAEQANSLTRAQNLYKKYYKTATTPSLKLTNCSRNSSIRGKTFGYSVSYTNDPRVVKTDGINNITSTIQAELPKKLSQYYIIPNNQQVFTQFNNQSTVGTISMTQTATIKRTDLNKHPNLVSKPTTTIKKLYNNCLTTILNRISGFGGGSPDNFVIKSVSFSYNSSRETRVSVTIEYLVAANYTGPNSNFYNN